MKKLFILLACAATVVACSKDETIASFQGDAIKFGNPFVGKVTRGETADTQTYGGDVADKSLTSFKVWGTVNGEPIYAETNVTGTVGGEWTAAADPQYWAEGANYKFAAIVDGTAATLEAGLPATISYTQASQLDLLYDDAVVNNAASNQGAVEFQFSHLLSKVKFTVSTNIAADGYSHVVKNIKVDNYTTGTYTVDGGTWAGATPVEIAFKDITVNESTNEASNFTNLLIPNAATFNVSFTVDFKKGDTVIWSQDYDKEITDDLLKGYSYNFKIDLSAGNEIKFKVDSNPTWTEDDPTIALQ